ncbi:glycosyltransferase family A protein [Synechococcus sp. CS-1328]|uniref:glycosyltransferase family 2 protein n=1 Tax=Synechococcus sp. CS-1328 TaxID=2847976 RepID=UPI00223B701A|nr:glycosyltransferase family A protein [Synechococcus sp. CS-1328]
MVTTIIPVFNRHALLREAVVSVLAQTHRPIEIIVVDDGSSDHTPEVAEALRQAHPGCIRVIQQANAGPGRTRQSGLERARGEFIQFLDSDDILLPHKFAFQVAALRASADAGIADGQSYKENHRMDPPRCSGPIRATGIRQNPGIGS